MLQITVNNYVCHMAQSYTCLIRAQQTLCLPRVSRHAMKHVCSTLGVTRAASNRAGQSCSKQHRGGERQKMGVTGGGWRWSASGLGGERTGRGGHQYTGHKYVTFGYFLFLRKVFFPFKTEQNRKCYSATTVWKANQFLSLCFEIDQKLN